MLFSALFLAVGVKNKDNGIDARSADNVVYKLLHELSAPRADMPLDLFFTITRL